MPVIRVAESRIGARQVGRRAMVVCGALVVPPFSSVYTPQDLANRLAGTVDHGGGEGRLLSTTFFYGTWVADAAVDREAYAAFVRASTKAVRRINADKRSYLHYYKRDYEGYPEVDALTPNDFNLGRIQVKTPAPIPEADARWDWEWRCPTCRRRRHGTCSNTGGR